VSVYIYIYIYIYVCVCVCVYTHTHTQPVPVAACSKARVCGRLPAGITDSNLAEGMVVCLL